MSDDIDLRDYQEGVLTETREKIKAGSRRIAAVMPTGAGKTEFGMKIMVGSAKRLNRVFFSVPRIELVRQTSDRLTARKIAHGIIDPKSKITQNLIQVVSQPTLLRRLGRVPPPKLIIADECHHSVSRSALKIWDYYPDAMMIGLTATPARLDGRGLGDVFDDMVIGPSVKELIDQKWLADFRYFERPPLEKLPKKKGDDFDMEEAAEIMVEPKIVGDVLDHYAKHGRGLPAIVFCCNLKHSHFMVDRFREVGIAAVHVGSDTPEILRTQIVKDFKGGNIRVLCQVSLLVEGFDAPGAKVCIAVRPTQSLVVASQAWGRVLRPTKDGETAIILDHANWSKNHGYPDTDRVWTLDSRVKQGRAKRDDEVESTDSPCKECYCVFPRADRRCPECGAEREVDTYIPDEHKGALKEADRGKNGKPLPMDELSQMLRRSPYPKCMEWAYGGTDGLSERDKDTELLRRLIFLAKARDYDPRWATRQQAMWRQRMGNKPQTETAGNF